MTWPQPTPQLHEKFCQIEGWAQVRDARGRTGTHHVTYELGDRTTYGPSIWVYLLIHRVGIEDATVAAMSKDEAVARLNRYWVEGI